VPPRRLALEDEDRELLRVVARRTWGYFEKFVGAEDNWLPPDNVQEVPTPRIAHRTSPTNIGMGLLAGLAAHDLGFIEREELIDRTDKTLTTMERLERHQGHLLNWYDTTTRAPLPPRYVSTVDSGNLVASLLVLAEGLREAARKAPDDRLDALAARAAAFADATDFRFLYDIQRRVFSIGYRLADAEGPGRLDASYYDLLASEARLASFIAVAKNDVPVDHWFRLGRTLTYAAGAPAGKPAAHLRSPPAQKARPAPVTTTARTASSAPSVRSASAISSIASRSAAHRFSSAARRRRMTGRGGCRSPIASVRARLRSRWTYGTTSA